MKKRYALLALLCVCTTLVAAAEHARAAVSMGRWRMVLTVPGGDLPFFVDLEEVDGAPAAWLVNGPERTPVGDVRVTDDAVSLVLPAFNSHIAATAQSGELEGTLRLIKRGGRPQVIPLRGRHGSTYRFLEKPDSAEVDVSGRWDVTFSEEDGTETRAVGVFEQDGNGLLGTFMTAKGDYRFLEGQVSGRDMMLSCFDGGHAFLFKATVEEDGELAGDFWSGTHWHQTWRAQRDDNAALPDPHGVTFLKPGYDRFEFEFPDRNGIDVTIDDERFVGKVIVVTIAGTWCRNCHDEAAFLSQYYKENQERGVEVVGLMYEHYRDRNEALRQIQRFAERYDIGYPLLLAGFSDKKEAAETLPMLNHVFAYPTHVFIDRQGAVRRIRTGIDGPGTGEAYETYKLEFRSFVDMLLAE
jgi:peroxiredoxin